VLELEVRPAIPKLEKIEFARVSISLAETSPEERLTTEDRVLLPIKDKMPERVPESEIFKAPTPAEAPETKVEMIELMSLLFERLAESRAALALATMVAICPAVRLTPEPLLLLIFI